MSPNNISNENELLHNNISDENKLAGLVYKSSRIKNFDLTNRIHETNLLNTVVQVASDSNPQNEPFEHTRDSTSPNWLYTNPRFYKPLIRFRQPSMKMNCHLTLLCLWTYISWNLCLVASWQASAIRSMMLRFTWKGNYCKY
jgi:hypothetical protein